MLLIPDCECSTSLSTNELLKKICVSQPYFALHDLFISSDHVVRATFNIENVDFPESFSLSSGEAGRHLAILGSCALALMNQSDDKYYYLAVRAVGGNSNVAEPIHRCADRSNQKFVVQAKASWLDLKQKKAEAEAKIFNKDGLEVSSLIISYKVFRCDLFRRLFERLKADVHEKSIKNPYTNNYPLLNLGFKNDVLSASTGIVGAHQCVGHFDGYPALPVAVLCSFMFEMAGRHYQHRTGNHAAKFCVDRIDLRANRLASVGEFLILTSHAITDDLHNTNFNVKACDYNGEIVSQVDIKLYVED